MTLTDLPNWTTTPQDVPAAARQIKAALRDRIEAGGRRVGDVLAAVRAMIDDEVADVEATTRRGDEVWPVVDFAAVAVGDLSPATRELIRRRGCLVVRGTFERSQAARWDDEIVEYVEANRFFERYAGPADDFFGSVGSKPEIYPIYWSRPQMEARQHPRMAAVQRFLASLWTARSAGRTWFDGDRMALYPDRIRRRPPGTTSGGLGLHLDPGTIDLWMSPGYQRAFRHLFAGDVAAYDPWDAAHRTQADQYPGSTMCSVFRTFQGWTALSEMRRDQGALHTVPIAKAMAALMLRPLGDDVDDEDLCGVQLNRAFPVSERWHPQLVRAASPVPDVEPGDTAWWHCDLIHAVAPVTDQRGWANVMYIPAAPWCAKNERYATSVRAALAAGRSPADFPDEHYEERWVGRFQLEDLNEIGRRGVGLD